MIALNQRELEILKMNNHYSIAELQHCISKSLMNDDISEEFMETIEFNKKLIDEMYTITDKIELMIQEMNDEKLV